MVKRRNVVVPTRYCMTVVCANRVLHDAARAMVKRKSCGLCQQGTA